MLLTRLWNKVTHRRRPETTVQIFRQAAHCRDAGRFEEARALVDRGLQLDPDNVVGLLLTSSLHVVFREMSQAKSALERVLTVDSTHPRALLGMARLALEEGDAGASTGFLRRALARYPEFPEAQALLEVVGHTGAPVRAKAVPGPAIRHERLGVPLESKEALLARIDGTLLFAQPRGLHADEVAVRTAQLSRLATAMLARCGLTQLTHAVIEGSAEMTFLCADDALVLSLTFGRDGDISAGLADLERLWANCHKELAHQVPS